MYNLLPKEITISIDDFQFNVISSFVKEECEFLNTILKHGTNEYQLACSNQIIKIYLNTIINNTKESIEFLVINFISKILMDTIDYKELTIYLLENREMIPIFISCIKYLFINKFPNRFLYYLLNSNKELFLLLLIDFIDYIDDFLLKKAAKQTTLSIIHKLQLPISQNSSFRSCFYESRDDLYLILEMLHFYYYKNIHIINYNIIQEIIHFYYSDKCGFTIKMNNFDYYYSDQPSFLKIDQKNDNNDNGWRMLCLNDIPYGWIQLNSIKPIDTDEYFHKVITKDKKEPFYVKNLKSIKKDGIIIWLCKTTTLNDYNTYNEDNIQYFISKCDVDCPEYKKDENYCIIPEEVYLSINGIHFELSLKTILKNSGYFKDKFKDKNTKEYKYISNSIPISLNNIINRNIPKCIGNVIYNFLIKTNDCKEDAISLFNNKEYSDVFYQICLKLKLYPILCMECFCFKKEVIDILPFYHFNKYIKSKLKFSNTFDPKIQKELKINKYSKYLSFLMYKCQTKDLVKESIQFTFNYFLQEKQSLQWNNKIWIFYKANENNKILDTTDNTTSEKIKDDGLRMTFINDKPFGWTKFLKMEDHTYYDYFLFNGNSFDTEEEKKMKLSLYKQMKFIHRFPYDGKEDYYTKENIEQFEIESKTKKPSLFL